MNVRKNAAAYHVRRSAVKNVQVAKSGIASARLPNPAQTNSRGLRRIKSATNVTKNRMS